MSTRAISHDRSSTHTHNHHPHSVRGVIDHITDDAYFGEEIDFVVGLTATALTADQVLKMRDSKHHKAMHLAKAGLGAAAAATAFTMMAKEHGAEKKHRAEVKERELTRGRLRQREGIYLEGEYADSLVDSESEGERDGRMVEYGRGTSVYDGRRYERSRSPSLAASHAPPRRVVSHSPVGREKRSDSWPRLRKFFEAVRDSLEEQNRQ